MGFEEKKFDYEALQNLMDAYVATGFGEINIYHDVDRDNYYLVLYNGGFSMNEDLDREFVHLLGRHTLKINDHPMKVFRINSVGLVYQDGKNYLLKHHYGFFEDLDCYVPVTEFKIGITHASIELSTAKQLINSKRKAWNNIAKEDSQD